MDARCVEYYRGVAAFDPSVVCHFVRLDDQTGIWVVWIERDRLELAAPTRRQVHDLLSDRRRVALVGAEVRRDPVRSAVRGAGGTVDPRHLRFVEQTGIE